MTLRRLVLDAGPLIGLFHKADVHHGASREGFGQLRRAETQLITPLPVLFEVFKWLLQREGTVAARKALMNTRRISTVLDVTEGELDDIVQVLNALPGWGGSLEDSYVLLLTRRFNCPLWTFNYRDFAAFNDLEFWNPSA